MHVFARGGKWGCNNRSSLRMAQEVFAAASSCSSAGAGTPWHLLWDTRVSKEDSWPPELCSKRRIFRDLSISGKEPPRANHRSFLHLILGYHKFMWSFPWLISPPRFKQIHWRLESVPSGFPFPSLCSQLPSLRYRFL